MKLNSKQFQIFNEAKTKTFVCLQIQGDGVYKTILSKPIRKL